jgi:RNA polymerase sigma-70 factor (ECF subfamily)
MTAPAPDDDALVHAAQRGDRAALDQLLRRHQPQLHAVCRRITGNDADALDATQEALVALVRGLPRFDGRSRFSTWAYRVATNASLDELRRRGRRAVPFSDEALDARSAHHGSHEPDLADAVVRRDEIDAALDQVALDFRAAVVLRDLCQLDYAEIAEVLEVPPGTVRSRIARGRAQLAAILGGNQPTPDERPTPAP